MISFVVDERVQDMVRALLPKNVTLESIALADISARRDGPVSRPALAAVALAGHAETMRAALSEGPDAQAMIAQYNPGRLHGHQPGGQEQQIERLARFGHDRHPGWRTGRQYN